RRGPVRPGLDGAPPGRARHDARPPADAGAVRAADRLRGALSSSLAGGVSVTPTTTDSPTTAAGKANGTTAPIAAPSGDEQQFVFRRVNWEFYEGLLALLGERRYRVTYDRGSLELMAPSWNHEWWSHRLDRVLTGIGTALGRDFVSGGSTTFR